MPAEHTAADRPTGQSAAVLSVLVDADNLLPRRIQPVLDLLAALSGRGWDVSLLASGRPAALARLRWPESATLLPSVGWQRADAALAGAYRPSEAPLVLASGDGDFALLAARHPGPVLVISDAASGRLKDVAVVVDPARDGLAPIEQWLDATAASG